jgi:hypothetical protein
VILMPVRGDAADDALRVLAQVREVRQHEVDPEHVDVREHEPAVQQEDAAVDLDAGAVPAYLAEPTEECDRDRSGHRGTVPSPPV